MPQRYGDRRIFRVKGSGDFDEATFKVSKEEAMILSLVNQRKIDREFRDEIQAFFDRIKELPKDEELMESRLGNAEPVVHAVETSQAAIPNRRRWTQNLHDTYMILHRHPDGLTDEEAQDHYAAARGLDRRDIGNSWRPSRNSLAEIGLVRRTGEKRLTRQQRQAFVWAVVDRNWTPPNVNVTIESEQIQELVQRAQQD